MTEKIRNKWLTIKQSAFHNKLTLFFILSIGLCELVVKLWNNHGVNGEFIYPLVFAVVGGLFMSLLTQLLPKKLQWIIHFSLAVLIAVVYSTQLCYYSVFRTPFTLYSMVGVKDAIQFGSVINLMLTNSWLGIIFCSLPAVMVLFKGKLFSYQRKTLRGAFPIIHHLTIAYVVALVFIFFSGDSPVSARTQYFSGSSPLVSMNKLGVMTTMLNDLEGIVIDAGRDLLTDDENTQQMENLRNEQDRFLEEAKFIRSFDVSELTNSLSIDFSQFQTSEDEESINALNEYFSNQVPTNKNEYSGIFKGYNLIYITAESFSPYAIDPVLMPTLYKMSHSGFVFNQFYNPLWGVSTTDGEYASLTGLVPKSGIWSFSRSGENFLPFVYGNQFKQLGYQTNAYHDHQYTYYDRDITHPNMGYLYKGIGNGLKMMSTWPESDVEMIKKTGPDYISNSQPFMTYYMSVSGHMLYNFKDNYIALKNKKFVDELPLSEASKAYLAANLELEFAMRHLLAQLELAQIDDKTVIVITPDHYPYGLPKENIDELVGHEVEDNFEIYKSTLIIWQKDMKPVEVNKLCSSLDVLPTVLNLFGLPFDSRLMAGKDILSDEEPVVFFANRSWMTESANYNSQTNSVTFYEDASMTEENSQKYIEQINEIVENRFHFSAEILETDYYRQLLRGTR